MKKAPEAIVTDALLNGTAVALRLYCYVEPRIVLN